jgi:hypothetical protein
MASTRRLLFGRNNRSAKGPVAWRKRLKRCNAEQKPDAGVIVSRVPFLGSRRPFRLPGGSTPRLRCGDDWVAWARRTCLAMQPDVRRLERGRAASMRREEMSQGESGESVRKNIYESIPVGIGGDWVGGVPVRQVVRSPSWE